VGVSRDSQEKNERFRRSLSLPFPVVSDEDGTIIRAYKVRWPFFGFTKRVTYVIGRDRKIRLVFHNELDFDGHAGEALRSLQP
jgi:thioredoxin-dependent peroxiredoxin